MNILIIDFCCNAVEMAKKIEHNDSDISHIYLLANMVCPDVWGSDRLTVINEQLDNQAILDLVKDKAIDRVFNMSSISGSIGLFELLKENNVEVIGTDKAFADTEINKLGFKKWLMEKNIRTPKLRREALMQHLLDDAETLDYPVTIKPDSQFGPKTLVINNPKELDDYFAEVKQAIPQAEKGIVFCLEDTLPGDQIIQVHYGLSGGRGAATQALAMKSIPKTDITPGGAMLGVMPWSGIERYRSEIQQIINKLASDHRGAYLGMLQCMLGDDGQLYVIENNARPSACNRFSSWGNVTSLLELLQSGDLKTFHQQLYNREGYRYAIGAALVHQSDSLVLDDKQFKSLMNLGCVSPYSFYREEDKLVSRHKRMSSMISVWGNSKEEVLSSYIENRKKIMAIAPYSIYEIDESVFSGT